MECKDLQMQGMWSEGLGTPVMSKAEVMSVLRSFGIAKFTAAVMWVLNEVFGGVNENENENGGCPQADVVGERECPRISRELKENIINPQMTQMDTDGCPQADFMGERKLPRIDREFKKNNVCPWLLCEPNEKEGRKLLAEIMEGGNFGQYDTRDAALKKGGMMKHGVWKLKRVMRLVRSYPEEALWKPVFRVWHLVWRGING